ncbi:class I SAM-dependent methyltransferase [Gephyromycinifex aptenodytis]|uniref:class I SAM-dependent methyltransferase n=1 Tax=Gephyromycinifex aptenodytis TaxID=2716227 RepID=UPI001445FDC6|nr:methyltransferase [Gephyromycinifex aptenodytis]
MPADQHHHYFDAEPVGPEDRRELRVELAGHDVTVATAAGIFCPDRLDLGTAVLLRNAPQPPQAGHLLDLGCGWGPVALSMGMLAPHAHVWGVDVNRRALALLTENAAALELPRVRAAAPETVPADITFETIWSNPPIRIGKAALHELLHAWLPRLTPGGTAYLVVQRNLGADSLLAWLAGTFEPHFSTAKLASAKGYRVLAVHHHRKLPHAPA